MSAVVGSERPLETNHVQVVRLRVIKTISATRIFSMHSSARQSNVGVTVKFCD